MAALQHHSTPPKQAYHTGKDSSACNCCSLHDPKSTHVPCWSLAHLPQPKGNKPAFVAIVLYLQPRKANSAQQSAQADPQLPVGKLNTPSKNIKIQACTWSLPLGRTCSETCTEALFMTNRTSSPAPYIVCAKSASSSYSHMSNDYCPWHELHLSLILNALQTDQQSNTAYDIQT